MTPAAPSVLVVDDHELVATSLVLGLRSEGLDAHACTPKPTEPVATQVTSTASTLTPGVVLLDLDLGPDTDGRPADGVGLVSPLTETGWRVVVVSGTRDRARIGAALDAGAAGALPKAAPLPRLFATVRAALAGRDVMQPARRDELIALHRDRSGARDEARTKLARLTQRENEVLRALAAGKRAQAVADTFVVSLATVRTQIRGVLTKLEVTSQLEAVALYRSVQHE